MVVDKNNAFAQAISDEFKMGYISGSKIIRTPEYEGEDADEDDDKHQQIQVIDLDFKDIHTFKIKQPKKDSV